MNKKDFRHEAAYQTVMHCARRLLEQGLIKQAELETFELKMRDTYKPLYGDLFSALR